MCNLYSLTKGQATIRAHFRERMRFNSSKGPSREEWTCAREPGDSRSGEKSASLAI